jgi:hypothetical protein
MWTHCLNMLHDRFGRILPCLNNGIHSNYRHLDCEFTDANKKANVLYIL